MNTLCAGEPEEEEVAMPATEEEKEEKEERTRLQGSAQERLTHALTVCLGGLDILHRRLGHPSETKLKKGLKNQNWVGSQYSYEELKNQRMRYCPACYEGQMKAFPRQPVSEKQVETGAKFGVDYKGPFSVTSIDGFNGFYLMVDYNSN